MAGARLLALVPGRTPTPQKPAASGGLAYLPMTLLQGKDVHSTSDFGRDGNPRGFAN